MVELQEVSRRFGQRTRAIDALREVTLRADAGAITAVVGPNGAGKSTLFAVLLGFLRPTSGAVRISGQAPRDYVRRNGAAWVPDRVALPAAWPVLEALEAFARLDGPGHGARRSAAEALDTFGLNAFADARIGTLSSGVHQRVCLAQALLAPRELVVLDEPAAGLDPLWRVRLRAMVEAQRARGAAVILASHDLTEVERTADRIVLLDHGRVREVLEPAREAGGHTWQLRLAAPLDATLEIFPGATRIDDAPASYRVEAADASELSHRLAALLAAGGTVVSVQPETVPLEQRVMRTLEPEG